MANHCGACGAELPDDAFVSVTVLYKKTSDWGIDLRYKCMKSCGRQWCTSIFPPALSNPNSDKWGRLHAMTNYRRELLLLGKG